MSYCKSTYRSAPHLYPFDPSSSDRKAIREEARIVERAIGIGPSALTGMVAMLQQNRDIKSA